VLKYHVDDEDKGPVIAADDGGVVGVVRCQLVYYMQCVAHCYTHRDDAVGEVAACVDQHFEVRDYGVGGQARDLWVVEVVKCEACEQLSSELLRHRSPSRRRGR